MSFSSLHHLPYNAFYIDLGQCYGLSEIDGIFVFLNPDGERIYVTQYILMDGMFFSYYNSFIKQNGSDLIEIKSESLPQSHYLYVPECMKGGEKIREKDIEVDRRKITMMCLQFVIYLSSQEPDILESPITKGTYKPSGERDKNKFSEIRMWETGYRFGASFRKKAEEYKKASETTEDKTGKKRKSPIPHFKCAHFQHYWVGKGRNTCIIRWKEAYPASLKDGAEIKEAVIHMG